MIYFETLAWDSNFFKFPVARIIDREDVFTNKKIFQNLFDSNINLAYYATSKQIITTDSALYEVKMVDTKIIFVKEIFKQPDNEKIFSYDKKCAESKLISLAIESGSYSRFFIDKSIGHKNFENLYTQWIQKSVSRDIADDVLVYKHNNTIVGFVTIGKKGVRADIGLIAVDSKFRGMGIGKALMQSAENFYLSKLINIQVVTQGNNQAARKLYESCGYKIESQQFFYHVWRKNI